MTPLCPFVQRETLVDILVDKRQILSPLKRSVEEEIKSVIFFVKNFLLVHIRKYKGLAIRIHIKIKTPKRIFFMSLVGVRWEINESR